MLKKIWKKKFYSVLTLSLALQTVLAPTYSFAESAEKSAEVYTEASSFKSIKEHVNEHSTHEEDIEVTGQFLLYTSKTFIIYREWFKNKSNIEITEQVVTATKKKGNAYYITTPTGAGWIDNNDNSLEVQEIHKLSNQKLIVKKKLPYMPFRSNHLKKKGNYSHKS